MLYYIIFIFIDNLIKSNKVDVELYENEMKIRESRFIQNEIDLIYQKTS